MKIFSALILLVTIFFFNSIAAADDVAAECQNKKSAFDKHYCLEKLFLAADTDLNTIYNLLKDSLTGPYKHQLVTEERMWIAERNQKCSAKSSIDVSCNLKMTRARTEELRARLAWIQSHTAPTNNIKPRRTEFNDCGYRNTYPREGWYDAQGQGVSNDYCRYVGDSPGAPGSPNNWFSCALAGENSDYSDRYQYTDTSPWINTFQPILPGDKCY